MNMPQTCVSAVTGRDREREKKQSLECHCGALRPFFHGLTPSLEILHLILCVISGPRLESGRDVCWLEVGGERG